MFFFFFKQKTAYEMRISDWSSDVCSSGLIDYCPKCRGVWLDRGELDKLIERSAQPAQPAAPQPQYHQPSYQQPSYGKPHKKRKSMLGEIFDFCSKSAPLPTESTAPQFRGRDSPTRGRRSGRSEARRIGNG